jgi:predicted transcriptional regulator
MPTRVRISVTLPPDLVQKADRRAAALDRSRSWVVSEALRRYLTPITGYPEGGHSGMLTRESGRSPHRGLGEHRLAQLEADLALTPEQRVREAEETARATEPREPHTAGERVLTFESYEHYLDWKRRADAGTA